MMMFPLNAVALITNCIFWFIRRWGYILFNYVHKKIFITTKIILF